ncbi:hypothetical protein [Actinomadura rugatobispora]|uniref:Fibronectin type-III domain-containing protein n=1 Tax=Actinomadura rugatobispora TaxID=1994 RepID=A0ABW1A7E2_9ACTN|nr:hypothetical protein GCM10010200_044830 [Actinomadura rugatobispora]
MLAAPLAMGLPVLGASVPAEAAATTVLAPQNGAVITSGSNVTARAHFDFAVDMQLRANIPGSGDTFLTKRNLAGDMSASIPLRRNGRYTVYMKGGITGHVYDSNTFTVRIPPAQPSGVSAKASGGKLVVQWNLGLEDDISGYTVSAGSAGSKSGSAGSLCSGTNCTTTLSIPSGASGSIPVKVRAKRPDGLGGSVSSGIAATSASVGSGSGSGSGSLGSVPPAAPGAAPPSGTAPLRPFNNESPVTLPSVQPDGAAPGFTYPTPQVANQMSPKAENASAIDSLQWGKSVGIALVLLVVAAHLGTWTRRLRVAQAGVSAQGKAARTARGGSGRTRVRNAREQIARAEAVAKTSELAVPLAAASGGKPARTTAARRGDTSSRQGSASAPRGGRRPGTSARGSSGVSVRIAQPGSGGPRREPVDGRGRHANSRGRRRK